MERGVSPCLPLLGRADFLQPRAGGPTKGVELRLELRGIPLRIALQHLLVLRHHLVSMLVDVAEGGLDLSRADAEIDGNPVAMPAVQVIIQDVLDSDPRAFDLGPAAAVDDSRLDHRAGPPFAGSISPASILIRSRHRQEGAGRLARLFYFDSVDTAGRSDGSRFESR
jgi:hypothetical protein